MDSLGDRMKLLEKYEAGRKLLPLLPICIRIDGKNFHSWTKGLARPYDEELHEAMVWTTQHLVQETNACIGYTQSDEISLILYSDNYKKQILFDGKIQKLTSVIASMTTAHFNSIKQFFTKLSAKPVALFDTRVWQVPSMTEAANVLVWRELDATRNSIESAARSVYSHNECFKKNGRELQDMLLKKGINWNDYPDFFKRGTYIQRYKVTRKFTDKEIEKLPSKHEAWTNPNLTVERSDIRKLALPPITRIINRESVIFYGRNPIV